MMNHFLVGFKKGFSSWWSFILIFIGSFGLLPLADALALKLSENSDLE